MRDLETTLRSLSGSIDWPEPSPHLAARVTASIEATTRPQKATGRWLIAAVVLTVLIVGLVPGTRQAVADLFVEAGVRIGFIAETPTIDADDFALGEETTLDEVSQVAGFRPSIPHDLGAPEAVFIGEDGHVSIVWESESVLLTQVSSDGVFAQKGVGPETSVSEVMIDDEPGIWIEGAGHTFTLLDEDGHLVEETTRLAANVLLWSADGIDYRLELTDGLDRALEIAESMEVS